MELHGETGKTTTTTDPSTGEVVTRAEGYEPPVLDAVQRTRIERNLIPTLSIQMYHTISDTAMLSYNNNSVTSLLQEIN